MDAANLHPTVKTLLQAINNKDSSAFASAFAANAVLVDESFSYTSSKAIRDFAADSLVRPNAQVLQILESVPLDADGLTHLKVLMDGDYAEEYGITEPFPLWLHISLQTAPSAANEQKISRLRIDIYAPGTPMMRAVWAAAGKTREDDPLAALRCDVLPVPDPPDETWVRIKMLASSLNHHDVFTLRGIVVAGGTYPLTLGNEGVGVLDDGTEVLVYPVMSPATSSPSGPTPAADEYDITLDPERHVFGERTQGLMSEYAVIPRANLVPKPAGMPTRTAAVMGVAWLTAYRMLFARSGLRRGQTMLVQGAAGGVATALVQLGAAAGMRVWATGRTEAKRALAGRLGASRVFAPGEEVPAGEAAAVFNLSGGATFEEALRVVRNGGTVVCCAIHGGAEVKMRVMDLFMRGITVTGSYMGTREEFESLLEFVARHGIEPVVDSVVGLDGVGKAVERMVAGDVKGKIVVSIAEDAVNKE
ncbi:NAD(P)-binding protein [Pleurostoma richardsiae]|uniref:NAD(P)-binding protein n=1 Tax=Pleurostoma richardsiae TaxID=41990 RepID=A0AA38R4I0_9PEZI|nr:NAD(P)-binding protein [Pleurostoma richardsiae]